VINGTGTDTDGTITGYAWTWISGPNTPTLTGANTANLTVNGLVLGTYVYRLTVTDNGGLTAFDEVSVVVSGGVNLALNKPATVSSLQDNTFQAGFAVDGNAGTRWSSLFTDPQYIYVDLQAFYSISRVKITWDVAYGKDYVVELANSPSGPWNAIKTVTNNSAMVNDHNSLSGTGRYVRVYGTARGTNWGYSIYELEVYGTAAPNMAPTANAGTDKSIILPTSSVALSGSGTDVDGTITGYAWTQFSGPNPATLSGAATANLTATGLVAGTYVFRLTVTDNGGLTGTDDATVIVYPVLTNLALNKPAFSSSFENSSYTVNYAVDGNAGSRWSSQFSDPQWMYVDLQATYNISRVKISWDNAKAQSYVVEVSGSSSGPWTNIYSTTTNSALVNDLTGLSGVGRYIRVYGTVRTTNWGYSIFELEVYGTPYGGGRIANDTEQKKSPTEETTYSFKVFPNPASIGEAVKLELSTIPGDLIIFDLLGRSHFETHVEEHQLEIPASRFTPGMYFFKYRSSTSADLQRVIVK
jgi:F5/8 type C domain